MFDYEINTSKGEKLEIPEDWRSEGGV